PVAGRWLLRSQLEGANVAGVQLLIDGKPIELTVTPLYAPVYAFEATLDLTAGPHELALQLSASIADTSASEPCGDLCLLNVTASLESPELALPDEPVASFIDASGQQASLELASVVHSAAGASLVTTWRLPTDFEMTDLPTLYVHITDADGNTVAQADHVLGENSLWQQSTNPTATFIDVVELPDAASDLEIRVGLWRPDTQSYFWATDPELTDSAGRLELGKIGDLMDDRPVR
ncbi:MAG: hypothetical protein KDE23_22370, partial [Caldilinea sp.]|nr:hypothetical protein [Caldilinea sp.]